MFRYKTDFAQQIHKKRFQRRLVEVTYVVWFLFFLLACRFAYLQIIRSSYYANQATRNQITIMPLEPSRGRILDRYGKVLAQNLPCYIIEIIPSKTPDLQQTLTHIQKITPISERELKRFKRFRQEAKSFQPILLKTKLTEEEAAKIAANHWRLPGVILRTMLIRDYVYGKLTGHFLGYVGRISTQDGIRFAKEGLADEYQGATYVGRSGIEAYYEKTLRGKLGFEAVETNAKGQALRVLDYRGAVDGDTLRLSIDIRLQEIADRLLGSRRGALVALNPQNGEILAFVSKPHFDPNLFVNGIDYESWNQLNFDWRRPLLNRASLGFYPPGSTLKPFIAMAALENNSITQSEKWLAPGVFYLPNSHHQFRGTKRSGHGSITLQKAITVSSDTFFYRLAWQMGIDTLSSLLAQFGFGQKTGIDLPEEAFGILPSRAWKARRFAKLTTSLRKWLPADTVSIGIGQGYNAYTPLQMAHATAILASDGKVFRPHFVRLIISSGKSEASRKPYLARTLMFKLANFQYVKTGMEAVLNAKEGTAYYAGMGLQYRMGGKTGTAQVVKIAQGKTYSQYALAEQHRDHAWFIGFAPFEHPTIAVAVIVENAGWGTVAAAPIARAVCDFYLKGIVPASLRGQLATLKETKSLAPKRLPKMILRRAA